MLPRPFAGNPGATARRLAQPPPPRLAVPPPAAALLSDGASQAYAQAIVSQLQAREVPAVAGPAHQGDWVLQLTAEMRDGAVVPGFSVTDPSGAPKGTGESTPVDAAGWANGTPALLQQTAATAAPRIAALLTSIEAQRRMSDPNSLRNRPPRVLVKQVTGAPGDGNESLTRQMRRLLPQLGETVQDGAEGADYTVTGQVRTAPLPGGKLMRVEVQWTVGDPQGHDLGHVVQLNEVPVGSLSGYWGDVALVVAQQAAAGVHEVIVKQAEGGAAEPAAATQPKP